MRVNGKEFGAGGIFILIGAFFAITALRSLDVGTAFRMGPGYFPLLLSAVLILLGIAIAARGLVVERTDFGVVPWRSVVLISIAPIVFGLTVQGLGLLPSLALACFLSAIASRHMGLLYATVLSIGLSIFCVALFSYGLNLPIPIIGSWLGG